MSSHFPNDPPLARRVLIQRHSQRAELREHPDPVPLEVAPGTRPATLQELVRAEVARLVAGQPSADTPPGTDSSPEDSLVPDWDDFDDDGDEFGLSGYQLAVMEEDLILQDRQNQLDEATVPETETEEVSGGESGTEDTGAT